jgi:histidinol-phosphatase (PHP family)
MWVDYHIHTLFSDGNKDLSEYVCESVKRKIDEIGFCDHIYFKETFWSMNFAQLPIYVSRIDALKRTAKIPIKVGLEVDFAPLKMDHLMQMINKFNFDFLMGAVHFIGDWSIDAEDQIHKWRRKNVDQVYLQYFTLIQDMAKSELFDIIGHLDLIKKFNFRPKKDITDLLRETVEIISRSKVCVEVNTSGLRRAPCREVYPSEELLKMCFDNGVSVTLGSDAHSPEEIGADFDKVVNLLKKVGYFEIVRFTRRNREFVKL